MKRKKLKNAPLREAIFELFWELPLDETQFPVDPEFDLAQGLFAAHISANFPVHKRINFHQNIKLYPKPVHQFWKDESTWPVIQLGPGVLTVNDTDKNYVWEDTYRPNIHEAVQTLLKSYKQRPIFNRATLQYIDLVDIDEAGDILGFISRNLQTDIINRYEHAGSLKGININQVFEFEDASIMSLNIQTAVNNKTGKLAIVWITKLEKKGIFSQEDIYEWIDYAHNIASDNFSKMLNPDFYDSFD